MNSAIGVDQTNESVIVGDAAVVKWATHLAAGAAPGAAANRRCCATAGFTGCPRRGDLVTWQPPDGAETLVASVDEYLPGAVDGWTWAVELVTSAAVTATPQSVITAAAEVGSLVAELHAALAATATRRRRSQDAARWRAERCKTLETVCALWRFAERAGAREPPRRDRGRCSADSGDARRHRASSTATATCTSVRCCAATAASW